MIELGKFASLNRTSISPSDIKDKTYYVGLEHINGNGKIEGITVGNGELASNKFQFKKGNILYGKLRPYLRKISLAKSDGICSTDIIPIDVHDTADANYVCYFLRSDRLVQLANSLTSGANLPRISPKQIVKLKIPLPPLPTQKKIAAILDEADRLRQLNQQVLDKYDALSQSVFLEMFGDPVMNPKRWEIDLLNDVADIIMGQSPKGDSYNINGIGSPLLNGPTEFGEKYPVEKQWTSEPKKFCKKGDILFCVRGATAGRMNWADKEYCIGRGLAAIRGKGITSDSYIYMILERLYDTFQRTSNGSTFINISRDDLRKVKIPRTSEDFQTQFADRIKSIDTQKSQAQAALSKSEDLFNSLLQRAFKGELVK